VYVPADTRARGGKQTKKKKRDGGTHKRADQRLHRSESYGKQDNVKNWWKHLGRTGVGWGKKKQKLELSKANAKHQGNCGKEGGKMPSLGRVEKLGWGKPRYGKLEHFLPGVMEGVFFF